MLSLVGCSVSDAGVVCQLGKLTLEPAEHLESARGCPSQIFPAPCSHTRDVQALDSSCGLHYSCMAQELAHP